MPAVYMMEQVTGINFVTNKVTVWITMQITEYSKYVNWLANRTGKEYHC